MADNNTAAGVDSLGNLTTATDNAAFGAGSLASTSTTPGNQNVAVGSQAGKANTTGGQNILIGYNAAPTLVSGSGNIVIGANADVPTLSTSNYLNIGGVITGDMTSATLAVTLASGFRATTQSPLDNSNKLATTAYVDSTSNGITSLATNSANTSPSGALINLSSYVGYPRLELVLSNIVGPTATNTALLLQFANGGTAVTGSVYSQIISGNKTGANNISTSPPMILPKVLGKGVIDGSGEILLRNFCNSTTTLYPSADMRMVGFNTGGAQGVSSYGICICDPNGSTFDGLVFVDDTSSSNSWTFDWALYGYL